MNTFNSPLEAFLYWEKNTPNRSFLKQFTNKNPKIYSYEDVGREVRRFATALNTYKLTARSNIAIIAKNSPHWIMADLAIMMAGHISVPIDIRAKTKVINEVLAHSESKLVIIDNLNDFKKEKIVGIPKISINTHKRAHSVTWKSLIKNTTL